EEIQTDPQRLGQILKNLISNAIKFTERGEVSLRVSSPVPGRIAFAVRDTGIGIPIEQQGIVFEAFRQADGSTHRKYGGTGLGLSISRDLARLLGGEITVHSGTGQGSVFTLNIPLTPPAAGETPGIPAPAFAATPAPKPAVSPAAPRAGTTPGVPAVEDDREHLASDTRR